MFIDKIPAGKNPPWDVNVIIEVPMRSLPIKYELDKESGALFVDRFLHTPMHYPANYGFIPNTLGGDGDPLDALVVGDLPILPGAVVRCRPIGVLNMVDDGGQDEKILVVPVEKLNPAYKNIKNYTDLPEILIAQIAHFFTHYKDLEKGKWAKVGEWGDADAAAALIEAGVAAAQK